MANPFEQGPGSEAAERISRDVANIRDGDVLNDDAPELSQSASESVETGFRPATRSERRNLWLKEYGEQDFALQMWVKLVEEQDWEIDMMLQVHGLLIFGVVVNTARYAQYYIDLNEELHRQRDPDTADTLHEYYNALVPPPDQPQVGPEGLPVVFRSIHMRNVTIVSGGHRVKMPFWRGKVSEVDAFVVDARAGE